MFLKAKPILPIAATIVAALSVLFIANATYAGPAQAKVQLNVRTGPGVGFNKLDRLAVGDTVEVSECIEKKWCYVEHEGPNGWVSAKYLEAVKPTIQLAENCKFVFKFDAKGPSFTTECEKIIVEDENDDGFDLVDGFEIIENQEPAKACFYTGINFTGTGYCENVSKHSDLQGISDLFASVRLYNGARVKVCEHVNFKGKCVVYNKNKARLATSIFRKVSSVQVYPKKSQPTAHKIQVNKSIVLSKNNRVDIDTGELGRAGADLQYRQRVNGSRYLRVLNGAKLSNSSGTKLSYEQCASAEFEYVSIRQNRLPVGSYICLKTDQGRISQLNIRQYKNGTIGFKLVTYKK